MPDSIRHRWWRALREAAGARCVAAGGFAREIVE
jgi:hypothetical protein